MISPQVYLFIFIPFLLWIYGLLYFIIQPLFEDECIIIVECRQICLNDFFIFQTKLKITGKIKLGHNSAFPCFGKHYIAKSVHCMSLFNLISFSLKIDDE